MAYNVVHGRLKGRGCAPMGELNIGEEFIVPESSETWVTDGFSKMKRIYQRGNTVDTKDLAKAGVTVETYVYKVGMEGGKMCITRPHKFQYRVNMKRTTSRRPMPSPKPPAEPVEVEEMMEV